jgi:spore coat polysaccharide biosynthesis protein SpsF
MIIRQLERLRRAETIDELVVATSTDQTDDGLAELLEKHEVAVFRGSLNDVLDRFISVMDTYGMKDQDAVIRLTADCPLADPTVIDRVVREFEASGADYCSNTLTPTYPDGLDVEVVRAGVLRTVASASKDTHEREHVTLGVYRRPQEFIIKNVSAERDLSDMRWTVDTREDFAFITLVYDSLFLKSPGFSTNDVLALLKENPEIRSAQSESIRNEALRGLDTGAMQKRKNVLIRTSDRDIDP